ncbi:unnamed protein product [Adineta steineri]|uniref:HPP transmembrane region domain-containing protein n=1 Tax=Adineta steineri TaxID=433720 RepID=A0A814KIG9_9BILA|nr:unnamed protein product [Adineta steineri]CAF1609748.1 unnamed protein product [Adineta steineri]
MALDNPTMITIDDGEFNHAVPPELIEVSPEILSKIENIEENDNQSSNKCLTWIRIYVKKFHGLHEERPKRLPWHEYIWSFIGALLGIAAVAFLHFRLLEKHQLSFLIGSFGASAVLIFGAPRSPLAQPRNLVGGHVISAICGCVVRVAIDRFEHSTACALAVALAIIAMQFTETVHPPGGATALLAVTTRPLLPWANFLFILMPALTGSCTMLLIALIINNIAPKRTYPSFWW